MMTRKTLTRGQFYEIKAAIRARGQKFNEQDKEKIARRHAISVKTVESVKGKRTWKEWEAWKADRASRQFQRKLAKRRQEQTASMFRRPDTGTHAQPAKQPWWKRIFGRHDV